MIQHKLKLTSATCQNLVNKKNSKKHTSWPSTLCVTHDLAALILPVKLPKSIQLLDPPFSVEATFPLTGLLTILAPF